MREKYKKAYAKFRYWRSDKEMKFLWQVEFPNALLEGWERKGEMLIFRITEKDWEVWRRVLDLEL